MTGDEGDIWFRKYADQILKELTRLDEVVTKSSDCVKNKMNRLKPAAIIGIISIFLAAGGIIGGGIRYMVLAEASKVEEKLNDCVEKDVFYAVDKKLGVVEERVKNIDSKVEKLNTRSEKVLEAIERMERKSNSSDDD